ncbi:ABC transporter ATP-binding protein [Streptomyces avidinii]|uniref:ATP-binding cassette domain-containing protein n=1 Tax=Streptomyces avidinii TaxID=1895 RepID=UPI0038709ABF|nr:ABC transporter ATP-binding protein [Streptomyces avidinii]
MSARPVLASPDAGFRLEARGISAGYHRNPIIEELSLGIEPGRITALVVSKACWKSTLLKSVARLLPVAAGSVLLEGQDIHDHRRGPRLARPPSAPPVRSATHRLRRRGQAIAYPDALSAPWVVEQLAPLLAKAVAGP